MELEKFITNTLLDIVNGIKNANKKIEGNDNFQLRSDDDVNFDIAITVTEKSSKSGEGGIKVMAVNLGGEKGSASLNENVSKIKFKVKPNYNVN